jgi:hypothetical protein
MSAGAPEHFMNDDHSPARAAFISFWRGILAESDLSAEEIDASCRHFRTKSLREIGEFCSEVARLMKQADKEERVEHLAMIEAKARKRR